MSDFVGDRGLNVVRKDTNSAAIDFGNSRNITGPHAARRHRWANQDHLRRSGSGVDARKSQGAYPFMISDIVRPSLQYQTMLIHDVRSRGADVEIDGAIDHVGPGR